MNIPCSEHVFRNSKGMRISYLHWQPQQPATGLLIIAHGIGEHIGRYHHVGQFFAERGIDVYGLDHQGHGKSEGKRGHVHSIHDYTHDIHQLYQMVQQPEPLPFFILGHSLGGLIACVYTLEFSGEISGTILSAPAIAVKMQVSPLKKKAALLMAKIMPSITTKNDIPPALLSKNQENVQKYINDPLVHPWISMSLGRDILTYGDTCRQNIQKYKNPFLLLFGEEDEIVDIDAAKELFDLLPNPQKKMIIVENCYHEIFNEDHYLISLKKTLEWMNSLLITK